MNRYLAGFAGLLLMAFCTVTHSAETCWPAPGKVTAAWGAFTVENYKWADIPASAGTSKPFIGWFKDACTGKTKALVFTKAEALEVAYVFAKNQLLGSESVNAWVAAQPAQVDTLEDAAYKAAFLAPKCFVQPQSSTVAGTRPVYTLKADQTRNTTAIAGVTVAGNTPCDATKRLGTTNYFFVPNIGGTVGYYALGVLRAP